MERYDDTENSGDEDVIETLERDGEERKYNHDSDVPYKKRKIADSVKPPTVEELNRLRETENLFNSSLFRMQIEEMMKEVQMKVKYENLFCDWLNDFRSYVLGLEDLDEYDLKDESWLKNLTVKPPVCLKPATDTGKFKFVCPVDITVGGSFSIKACLGPLYTVDVYIHIPEVFFQKIDPINLRYDRKRAFYLTVLAEFLIGCSLVEEMNFVQANGCIVKPLLEVKPSGNLGQHVRVLLRPVTTPDALVLSKLRPGRGNIHPNWFYGGEISGKNCIDSPSPHHNSQMAQDLVWKLNQEMMESELSTPSVQAGLILLKIWLRQRHFDKGYGSFGGFVMAMYLVYLLQNRRLNKRMSSYQVARVTWNCLAQSDWTKDGISLGSTPNSPNMSDFHKHFEVVFVDASGFCNICAHMRKEIYAQVKIASAQAVSVLDMSGSHNFQALFMMPVEFEQCHDVIIRFKHENALVRSVKEYCTLEQTLSQAGWMLPLLLDLVLPCLEKGLGKRIISIGLQAPKVVRWTCSDPPPSPSSISLPLILGLRLNSAEAFEHLQKGPDADQPEANEFRSFWGELSHLRRFRDGCICEAVLWKRGLSPCEQVVNFVLKKHIGLSTDSYYYLTGLTDGVLKLPKGIGSSKMSQEEVAVQAVISSFDALTKQLRALSDVTLSVNTVQGISPLFRYADVFPPLALKSKELRIHKNVDELGNKLKLSECERLPKYCAPVEAVMTLEVSGKWPKNLEAVRRLKTAFCLQMAKALQNECKLCTQVYKDYVDILKDGFVFRIWLSALKEVSLMKQQVGALGLVSYHDTPETSAFEQKLVLLPKLTSSLHGLHRQFPGFGPTARIAKRWVSSQLMGPPHFPDLVIELLVAYLFLSPEPFHPPVQSQLGLLQFLRLVSSTDWLTVPIIVNLNAEFTRERIAELETRFHSSRRSLPPLYVATPYDRSVSQCTRIAPTLQMLIRLGFLASEGLKVLQEQILASYDPNILPIFRPNLEEYDVIIRLNKDLINRVHESIDKKNMNRLLSRKIHFGQKKQKIPVVDFDPVQFYLAELREEYSKYALFFHDQYGGNIVGVVWKPLITQTQDFKVFVISGHKPADKSKAGKDDQQHPPVSSEVSGEFNCSRTEWLQVFRGGRRLLNFGRSCSSAPDV